jgi:hypothetical protein
MNDMPKPVAWLLIIGVGFAAYVLGARAGRSRYREISHAAKQFWNEPSVSKARKRAGKVIDKAAKKAASRIG